MLYDRDCGFCRWSLSKILDWDRGRRLRPLAIQSQEARRLLEDAGVPEERWLESWHLVHPDGRVESAEAAFPALFRMLPAGVPIALVTRALPGLSGRGYRLVAANRRWFGRPVSDAMRRRADAKIAARS